MSTVGYLSVRRAAKISGSNQLPSRDFDFFDNSQKKRSKKIKKICGPGKAQSAAATDG